MAIANIRGTTTVNDREGIAASSRSFTMFTEVVDYHKLCDQEPCMMVFNSEKVTVCAFKRAVECRTFRRLTALVASAKNDASWPLRADKMHILSCVAFPSQSPPSQ